MASTIKVDNVQNTPGTNTINKCGSAVTVGASGNTVSVAGNDIRSNAYKASDGGVIASQCGTTITLGASGDTVALASGASQTGFGREGSVDWQTGSIKSATFTATSGEGYFCNTSGGAFTVNLPAGSAGAIVAVADYTRTFLSNNLTISPNGSEKIGGVAADAVLNVDGQSSTFVYVDSTEGWINVQETQTSQAGRAWIIATVSGACNTLTTSGDYKIAKFVGPGTFCVSTASSQTPENIVSYMVVAGGGNGGQVDGNNGGGAGGGGGYREVISPSAPYTGSPLNGYPNSPNRITLTATGYPITVGAAASSSVFSTITSAGGATGRPQGLDGGSGAGGSPIGTAAGSGNTPPTTPPQGNNGGTSIGHSGTPFPNRSGGGGGGAGGTGGNGSSGTGGSPGSTTPSEITGSGVNYSQGGKGACGNASSGPDIAAVNTGNGNGGKQTPAVTRNGSSGIVVIRYKYQN